MQFYVNEAEAAIGRVATVNNRLSSLISDLTGPAPESDLGPERALGADPQGLLPQLSNNMGELSGQLRVLEERVDRLEAILGLDRPAPTPMMIKRLEGRN